MKFEISNHPWSVQHKTQKQLSQNMIVTHWFLCIYILYNVAHPVHSQTAFGAGQMQCVFMQMIYRERPANMYTIIQKAGIYLFLHGKPAVKSKHGVFCEVADR